MKTIYLALGLLLSASGFTAEVRNRVQPVQWDSGSVQNIAESDRVVMKKKFHVKKATGLRVHFKKRVLGKGVFLKVTSNKNRRPLKMDDRILKAFRYSTPYLNGNSVTIELVVPSGESSNGFAIRGIEIPVMVEPRTETICGSTDERAPSKSKPIARMMKVENGAGGCTGTMIGLTCMVSAGHCKSYLNFAQFNVPPSDDQGKVRYPEPSDQYPVSKVYGYQNDGPGNDWAVYRLRPNPVSEKLPGEVQGFLKARKEVPQVGAAIRITGYGSDDDEPNRNFAQQTLTGPIVGIGGSEMRHAVDTMPGNSGSSIVLEETQEVIGIHTHGGCDTASGSANSGTVLAKHAKFMQAVAQCLADDKALIEKLEQRNQ
ncbi:MAG: trypsin-like serine protease [Bdellovibrionota bacterium]